ncbi:unnamed protein product [Citrullus colocynthis]|uniref:Uncharacterized protein n=1 Tax=Citrullus colocynthis TaxID=252529 RepID=A0ABP0YZD2_9ROSI
MEGSVSSYLLWSKEELHQLLCWHVTIQQFFPGKVQACIQVSSLVGWVRTRTLSFYERNQVCVMLMSFISEGIRINKIL